MAAGERPDAALAASLAEAAMRRRPLGVTRFTTGLQHYVFEVTFADAPPVVMRIASATDGPLMADAARLNRWLRPLGVPLPAILAEGLGDTFAWLMLERLNGTDLGHVIAGLPSARLSGIAATVASAQTVVAATPSAGRFGYAVDARSAPHERWSDVPLAGLLRSQRRILANGLYESSPVDRVMALFETLRPALDRQPATPFLHDTTTKNVIVTAEGRVSGIVDVDDLCFGDPRYPIALTFAALTAFGGPVAYAETWLHAAGLPDDRLFRFYVAQCVLDFMSEQGEAFNGNTAAPDPATVERLERILGDCLDRAR